MSEMIFSARTVEVNDLPMICSFPQNEQELYFMFPKADFPLTVEQLGAAITERFESTVVIVENRVVGFANFYKCEPGLTCSIGNVIVATPFRGKGAGRFLIETMERIAIQKYKVKEIQISCFNQNTQGLLLYSKMGYIPSWLEQRIDKAGNPVVLVHLKKEFPND